MEHSQQSKIRSKQPAEYFSYIFIIKSYIWFGFHCLKKRLDFTTFICHDKFKPVAFILYEVRHQWTAEPFSI